MKKVFLTLLAALLVIAAVVFAKNAYSPLIPIGNRGIRAVSEAGDLDILFVGSSTFRSNIDIGVLDKAYDGADYILAYGGNQLIATDIQYDELKERCNRMPKKLILELDPLMLTEEIKVSDSRVIWDLSLPGKWKLYRQMTDACGFDFALTYEYFVTSGLDDLVTYPITEPIYTTRYNKGAKTDETPSSGKDYLENEKFDISDSTLVLGQELALRNTIEKCIADGQEFVYLESPHYYRLQEDATYQAYFKQILAVLDEYDAPYVLASDVDFDRNEADYFEDMSHMSAEGRRVYTEMVLPFL